MNRKLGHATYAYDVRGNIIGIASAGTMVTVQLIKSGRTASIIPLPGYRGRGFVGRPRAGGKLVFGNGKRYTRSHWDEVVAYWRLLLGRFRRNLRRHPAKV